MKTISAGYICKRCGINTAVDVRERATEEGIENYVYHVARMCGEHHGRERPLCDATAVDIKIPMSRSGIGKAGEPLSPEEIAELNRKS